MERNRVFVGRCAPSSSRTNCLSSRMGFVFVGYKYSGRSGARYSDTGCGTRSHELLSGPRTRALNSMKMAPTHPMRANDANESIEYDDFYTASWDGQVDKRPCGGDRDGVKVEVNRK